MWWEWRNCFWIWFTAGCLQGFDEWGQQQSLWCIYAVLTYLDVWSVTNSFLATYVQSGKYVVLKSDLKTQKEPCLWRIDGKNLLQKYEPILFRESLAYHNISTVSNEEKKPIRLQSKIKLCSSLYFASTQVGRRKAEGSTYQWKLSLSHSPKVRWWWDSILVPSCWQSGTNIQGSSLSDRWCVVFRLWDSERVQERMTREIEDTCDSFRVYLQTLMSQALDDNFLTEINVDKGIQNLLQLKWNTFLHLGRSSLDDYFLGSICAIEEGWVRPRMANLESSWSSPKIKVPSPARNCIQWIFYKIFAIQSQELLQSYPLYELASLTTADQSCSRCQMKNPTRRMLFRPVTYSMDSMRESEFITDKLVDIKLGSLREIFL